MFPIRDHNPSQRIAFVTWALIALNIAIHLLVTVEMDTDRELSNYYFTWAMIPARIANGDAFYTLLSSMFLHGDIWHLAGNMLFLWIFGDNLEDTLGHFGFLAFYLACGTAAALGQWVVEPWSPIPVLGASGAIAGVMGGYLLLFPKARVDILIFLIVFVRILPIPAWLMLGLWFFFQIAAGVGADPATGGVAYWAHAGGFVAGIILMTPVFIRRGGPAWWSQTHGQPPHPEKDWGKLTPSRIPVVPRRRTGPPHDPTRRTPWGK